MAHSPQPKFSILQPELPFNVLTHQNFASTKISFVGLSESISLLAELRFSATDVSGEQHTPELLFG